MRNGDFKGLKECYAEEAWEVVSRSIPSDKKALAAYKTMMAQVKSVTVKKAMTEGTRAEITVSIDSGDGTEEETLILVQRKNRWVIE